MAYGTLKEIAKKAPNPVTNLTVTGVTTSTISISFTANSDASSYLVDWGTVNSTDETEDDMLAQGNATITDTTYTITNLGKNQLYLIMVTSLGSDGTGENSATAYGKTLNVDPVTNVSVTEVSTTSITVKFDSSQYAIKYYAIAITADDSGTASQTFSTTVSNSPATITGLSPNTKYKVGVSAIGTNNDLSDYVYVDNVTTLAKKISPVTNLQVTKVTDTSISISFTGSEGAVKYKITATNTTDRTDTKTMEVTETTATITGLKQNTEYEITVVAVDRSGNESNGLSISVSTENLMFINVGGSAKRFFPQNIYINTSGHTSNTNLVYNGNAELGEDGWNRMNTNCFISDDVPTGLDGVKHSFVSSYITKDRIKVYVDKYYYLSVWIKNQDSSFPLYFSFVPRDADGLQILHWKCDSGVGHTKLAKDLKNGDNVVYLEDASGWNTGKNFYNYIIIFGYTNSLGYTYPDYTYSQNTIKFANDNTIDKSVLIDKTNNTVALPSAYTGKTIAKGTAVSQSHDGSSYLYPFGILFNTDWKQKTFRGTFREMIRKINDISYINATDAIDKINIVTSSYKSDEMKVADIKFYESYEETFGDTVNNISSLDVNVNGVAKKVF